MSKGRFLILLRAISPFDFWTVLQNPCTTSNYAVITPNWAKVDWDDALMHQPNMAQQNYTCWNFKQTIQDDAYLTMKKLEGSSR